MFKGVQVSVTTSATQLSVQSESDSAPGQSIGIMPTASLYAIGDSNVTYANGCQIPANTPYAVDLGPTEQLYAVAQAGTITLHVTRSGV